ncbi:hypothetical protein BV22DRAFT_1135806 [Leucogyrophana mollusca]|uniref:Uncharacterized protein n=1 Tax=Leucogyrophana mollusca TaxID=85980 RepID=A0ACB8AU99_9AGAM|nr:hypothetical protein BV22DRAFT_1135806 [Leucogyrophana mollusca]
MSLGLHYFTDDALPRPRSSCLGWTDELVRVADALVDLGPLPARPPDPDAHAVENSMEVDEGDGV